MILAKLETLEEQISELRTSVEEIKIGRAHEAGQASGATWALSKIGAAAVLILSGAGWLVVNGIPTPVKKLFSP